MTADKKLLILGASGFIGRHMIQRLDSEAVIATHFSASLTGGVRFDAISEDLSAIVRPDDIWHCMILNADSHPDSCARDAERSNSLNVESTKRVISQLSDWDIPFTFASSEMVFDGTLHEATETTQPNPIMLYGRQKLAIEQFLMQDYPDAPWTIMRLGKVFGSAAQNEKLFAGWIDAIERGERIRIAEDQIFSPIYVEDIVSACLTAADVGLRGLYHLCGDTAYSRIDLLYMTIKSIRRYRPVEPVIETCSIDDFNLLEPRPKDVSMRPDKIVKAIGITITPTPQICDMIVDQYYQRRGASETS